MKPTLWPKKASSPAALSFSPKLMLSTSRYFFSNTFMNAFSSTDSLSATFPPSTDPGEPHDQQRQQWTTVSSSTNTPKPPNIDAGVAGADPAPHFWIKGCQPTLSPNWWNASCWSGEYKMMMWAINQLTCMNAFLPSESFSGSAKSAYEHLFNWDMPCPFTWIDRATASEKSTKPWCRCHLRLQWQYRPKTNPFLTKKTSLATAQTNETKKRIPSHSTEATKSLISCIDCSALAPIAIKETRINNMTSSRCLTISLLSKLLLATHSPRGLLQAHDQPVGK